MAADEAPAATAVATGGESPALTFTAVAKALAAGARRAQLVAPAFRTPPRLVGLDRTVQRRAEGGTVSVRLRGRPWAAVLADMIEGVVAVNALTGQRAGRVRADLWDAVTRLDVRDRYVA